MREDPAISSSDRGRPGAPSPRRIPKLGALIKPATLLKFHKALVARKYRLRQQRSLGADEPDTLSAQPVFE